MEVYRAIKEYIDHPCLLTRNLSGKDDPPGMSSVHCLFINGTIV